MADHEDMSDEPEISSSALHDLLSDLNGATHSQRPAIWRPSNSSPETPNLTRPISRLPSREYPRSISDIDLTNGSNTTFSNAFFSTPNRSIFSSGPPTSSVSASTAQASISGPSSTNPTLPLAALKTPAPNLPRRTVRYQSDRSMPLSSSSSSSSRRSRIPRAEKEVDDPNSPLEESRWVERGGLNSTTPMAVSRLFTAPETAAPVISGNASYVRAPNGVEYKRANSYETSPLPNHLLHRGLISGRHSDITVHAFGMPYPLHRLLLDRAPFFSSALSEPWYESSSKEITLQPENLDSNITQAAFEFALKRIYGGSYSTDEDGEAVGLFATACWLEMADLVNESVTSLLKQMSPAKIASYIRLVTNSYYGKSGERILSSAKAMLCREGWEMPLRYWDDVPGDIVREIIGGDGFYVPGELERWFLTKKILDRKLKALAMEMGLVDNHGRLMQETPRSMSFMAIRFDSVYRRNPAMSAGNSSSDFDPWLALYTDPDIAAILVLLDEGIHYVHLSFEQLQYLRSQKDILGVPAMAEEVISNALWMSMELRQKIINARELDMELGLSENSEEMLNQDEADDSDQQRTAVVATRSSKGKQLQTSTGDSKEEIIESGSWDRNGRPRKFWIPPHDLTTVQGGNPEAHSSGSHRPIMTRHLSRLSASLDPQDVQWASDFTSSTQDRPQTPCRPVPTESSSPISFTHFPPFRFAAEFPPSRLLKDKKRVYSRTVWYAGSLWNVYVQKMETAKNTQLGVYLHRAKEKEGSEDLVGGFHSVEDRIGHLEAREHIMRRNDRRNRRQMQLEQLLSLEQDDENSGSGGDLESTLIANSTPERSGITALTGLLQGQGITKASQTPECVAPDHAYGALTPETDDETNELIQASQKVKFPALPPYIDGRPTIKTYFKIFTPSKGGRMLSVYESAPDKFNFSQSWGWKSSNMVLDDKILGFEEGSRGKDGRLRFMVVIGNV